MNSITKRHSFLKDMLLNKRGVHIYCTKFDKEQYKSVQISHELPPYELKQKHCLLLCMYIM